MAIFGGISLLTKLLNAFWVRTSLTQIWNCTRVIQNIVFKLECIQEYVTEINKSVVYLRVIVGVTDKVLKLQGVLIKGVRWRQDPKRCLTGNCNMLFFQDFSGRGWLGCKSLTLHLNKNSYGSNQELLRLVVRSKVGLSHVDGSVHSCVVPLRMLLRVVLMWPC